MAEETEKKIWRHGVTVGLFKRKPFGGRGYVYGVFITETTGEAFDSVVTSKKDVEKLSKAFGIKIREM